MSPGWQLSSLHIAFKVEKRIALALLFFKIERLAGVMSTLSARSPEPIFLIAITTSKFTLIIAPSLYCKVKLVLHLHGLPEGVFYNADNGDDKSGCGGDDK